jgi:beta-glucosidase
MSKGFKEDFVWGVATASYQIEGAAKEDGRGDSVWDMLCRKPGAIFQGHNGDVACDHYHRFKEDVALMKELGVKGYRFSLSWSRLIPDGIGAVNPKGIAFYDSLIDELLKAGIKPYATLFHWDYPTALYNKGGWLNRESIEWFANYTNLIVDRFSDRIQSWMTLNEPQCFILLGHQSGVHAPGLKLSFEQVLQAAHHSLLAHGTAVQLIRANAKSKPSIGFAPVGSVRMPVDNRPENIEAARQDMFSATQPNMWSNAFWMDPVFLGRYPEADWIPNYPDDDLKTIAQPLDFFGMNTYQGNYVKLGDNGPESAGNPVGHARTAIDWPVTPECLYWGPKFFYERYKKPILVTENGMAGLDWVSLDGKVHDPQRIDYLHRHLLNLRKASEDDVDIDGYLQWTLIDNFEWAEGYKQRFGLVYLDGATQSRLPKDSFHWYKDVISSNGSIL